jgi:hypothetical protein
MIFEPGKTIIGKESGQPTASRLLSALASPVGTSHTKVNCEFVDYDGEKFGYQSSNGTIKYFNGVIPIAKLDYLPLELHPNCVALKETLTIRGRLFQSLAGCHYRGYKEQPPAKLHEKAGSVNTSARRVVIDAASYWKQSSSSGSSILVEIQNFEEGTENGLLENDLIHCTHKVRGYDLKTKRWEDLLIKNIIPVQFNKSAFRSLVLPYGQKELIVSFIQSQINNPNAFDDVISGKGKGIIMLFSGGPGTGKTLTAESVAEEMQLPLYSLSAADLGSNANVVEQTLDKTLSMVSEWNAILLVDECDVFLEARNTNELERNRMVSIFLRRLEYFEGVMFLTTNRVERLDPAFYSRIHRTLKYPKLDIEARKTIWKGFLRTGYGLDTIDRDLEEKYVVSEEDIERLAEVEMNGRQIKNIVKTATLLAMNKGVKLGLHQIQAVLKIEGFMIKEKD